jgi:hypothetical protein
VSSTGAVGDTTQVRTPGGLDLATAAGPVPTGADLVASPPTAWSAPLVASLRAALSAFGLRERTSQEVRGRVDPAVRQAPKVELDAPDLLGPSRTAYLFGGHAFVDYSSRLYDLGPLPPTSLGVARTGLSQEERREIREQALAAVKEHALWPVDAALFTGRPSTPAWADPADLLGTRHEAHVFGPHLFVLRDDNGPGSWFYAGLANLPAVVTPATVAPLSRAELEQSLVEFVKANAGDDRLFPNLDGGNCGLHAFLLDGKAATRLINTAVAAGGAATPFDPARHVALGVLDTGDEPILHAFLVDRATGTAREVGSGMNFVDALDPDLIPGANGDGFRACYLLLEGSKALRLGGEKAGWSIAAFSGNDDF